MDIALTPRLFKLRKKIVDGFHSGNWEEVGLLTGATQLIANHPRLLRSLSWGDPDYGSNVLTVLRQIVEQNFDSLLVMEMYVDEHFPAESIYVSAESAKRRITFAPNVFQIPEGDVNPDLVAVMMPFQQEFSAIYAAIKRATLECGFTCLRADDIWEHATIVQDIFTLIFRAHVVVVDFTGKNPNVMYETGISHTLGKHVVPISQSLGDVPFDMQHHRVLKYFPNAEGLTKLSSDLSTKLRTTRVGTTALPAGRIV